MSGMKSKILIVEDDIWSRRLMEYLLSAHYEVASVENGREALDWLKDGNHVDLIITDVEMPLMTGIELVNHLHELPMYADTPFMFVSSLDRSSVKLNFEQDRRFPYLPKPLEVKSLMWKVEELLTGVSSAY